MIVSVLPVSTRKSKGPAPLMVTGTTIMSLTTLNLTRKGSWPMPEGRLERQKETKARRRLERRSEGIGVHLENREHRGNSHSSACRLKSWRKPDFYLLEFSRRPAAAGNKGFLRGLADRPCCLRL